MPHLTARLPEARLAGHEPALIAALTDAVVGVYGEWARAPGSDPPRRHTGRTLGHWREDG